MCLVGNQEKKQNGGVHGYKKMKDFGEVTVSATAAFEAQLKALCIQEFPCGFGTWVSNTNIFQYSVIDNVGIRTSNSFLKYIYYLY